MVRTEHRFSSARMLLVGAAVFFSCTMAWAIPNNHLNSHPHDAGKVAYPGVVPADPETANHTHVKGIAVKEVGGFLVDDAAVPQWVSEAAWDDRFLRFIDADSNNTNDLSGKYGHGYIDPTFRPRYRFDATDFAVGGSVPGALANVQARIGNVWQTWDAAAKAQGQATRTAPDGSALKTSVVFQDNGTNAAGEILIDFIPGYQAAAGAAGEWVVSPTQLVVGGAAAVNTLALEPNPTASVFVNNADWQVSSDGLALGNVGKAFAPQTPALSIPWNFGAGAPAALAQDIDYLCVNAAGCGAGVAFNSQWEGGEAAFAALGLTISDSWGGSAAPAVVSPLFQADFLSVAIHEWGHLIGLLHSPGGTMNAASPFTLNVLTQSIDVNNAKGAAALYSISVPEPASMALMVIAGIAGVLRRQRAA